MRECELFSSVGEALWGDNWKGQASRELGVRKPSILEMANGKSRVPAGIWERLHILIVERRSNLEALAARILQAKAGDNRRSP